MVMTWVETGERRRSETGLDYFGARYVGAAQGRFTSPDPITVTPGRVVDPQQLNLYAYARRTACTSARSL
jgi:RHS repeat-associated protein